MSNVLYGSWNLAATKSLRYSCSSPTWGRGFNLQTMPKYARYYVVAPEERIFVGFDLDQVELRVVAYEAGCRFIQESMRQGRKVHRLVCCEYYKIPPAELDTEGTHAAQYRTAKSVVHGSNYRETPKKISIKLRCKQAAAKQLQDFYLRMVPELRAWQEGKRRDVMRTWKLTNLVGLERVFYAALSKYILTGEFGNDEWNDACSWTPQTIAPYVTNQIIRQALGAGQGAWLHHHGHDSALFSVPEAGLDAFVGYLAGALDRYRLPGHPSLALPGEVVVGWSWGWMVPPPKLVTPRAAYIEALRGSLNAEKVLRGIQGDLAA